MRVGIIAALRSEAAVFAAASGALGGGHAYEVRVGGPGADNAAQCARDMLSEGCDVLVSWGVAGGLCAAVGAGQLVIGSETCSASGERLVPVPSAQLELESLLRALEVRTGCAVSVSAPVATAPGKQSLHRQTGAAIVDMESETIARLALDAGAGFAFVRAVVDAATVDLPAASLLGLSADGATRTRAVIGSILRQPAQLPALLALGRDYRRALSSLRQAARALCAGAAG